MSILSWTAGERERTTTVEYARPATLTVRDAFADRSPPVQDPADVRGLADVLQAVVGDAHEPYSERHRRIPPPVDDAVEVGRGQRREQLLSPGADGFVVLDEHPRIPRAHRQHL